MPKPMPAVKDFVHETPAEVIYVSGRDTIQILLSPGHGGVPVDIPLSLVPPDLRMANSKLLVTMRNGDIFKIVRDDYAGAEQI